MIIIPQSQYNTYNADAFGNGSAGSSGIYSKIKEEARDHLELKSFPTPVSVVP